MVSSPVTAFVKKQWCGRGVAREIVLLSFKAKQEKTCRHLGQQVRTLSPHLNLTYLSFWQAPATAESFSSKSYKVTLQIRGAYRLLSPEVNLHVAVVKSALRIPYRKASITLCALTSHSECWSWGLLAKVSCWIEFRKGFESIRFRDLPRNGCGWL